MSTTAPHLFVGTMDHVHGKDHQYSVSFLPRPVRSRPVPVAEPLDFIIAAVTCARARANERLLLATHRTARLTYSNRRSRESSAPLAHYDVTGLVEFLQTLRLPVQKGPAVRSSEAHQIRTRVWKRTMWPPSSHEPLAARG
jgi:hypothetical protein